MAKSLESNVVEFPGKGKNSFTSKVGEFYRENYETIENLGYTAVAMICVGVLGAIIYRAAQSLDVIPSYIIPN